MESTPPPVPASSGPASAAPGAAALASTLQQAIALHQQGQLAQAAALYLAILETDPRHLDALYLLGLLASTRGQHDTARTLLQQVLAIAPFHAQAHFTLGNIQQGLQHHDEALASYDHALRLAPAHAEAHYNRAMTLQALQRYPDALAAYDAALQHNPADADTFTNRGTVLQELHRLDDALASFEHALRLRPGYPKALYNRGTTWQKLHDPARALADFDAALAGAPDYLEAHINRGAVLEQLGRHAEALAAYARALQIDPGSAKAHWNEGLARLAAGEFALGWRKHEWRWEALNLQHRQRLFPQPLWLGEQNLAGRTILLHAEQGYGDTLQFCRYASLVAARGATVLLEVQPPLKSLMSSLAGVHAIFATGEALPAFDYHCPLLSLPLAFQTELETIPAGPAYLQAPPALQTHWRARLDAETGVARRPRIGLAWSGNPAHGNDHNRSLTLAQLAELTTALPQAALISVQKEIRERDHAALTQHPALRHFGDELSDFSATAALIANLDLVITVDTSIAHLSGALGVPVWILLPFNADWRWLHVRSDNPWYPSARLWRQTVAGDWAGVLAAVAAELRHGAPMAATHDAAGGKNLPDRE